MIESRLDKDRVKCPHCGAFLMEVKPKMFIGQTVICKCKRCLKEVEITKR